MKWIKIVKESTTQNWGNIEGATWKDGQIEYAGVTVDYETELKPQLIKTWKSSGGAGSFESWLHSNLNTVENDLRIVCKSKGAEFDNDSNFDITDDTWEYVCDNMPAELDSFLNNATDEQFDQIRNANDEVANSSNGKYTEELGKQALAAVMKVFQQISQ